MLKETKRPKARKVFLLIADLKLKRKKETMQKDVAEYFIRTILDNQLSLLYQIFR
jgi:hypothetical protein